MSYQDRDIFDAGFCLNTDKPQTLAGKLAVVTGATRGIGLEIALTLASHGCAILGTYSTSDSAASRLSTLLQTTKFVGVAAPITNPTASVPAILAALTREFPNRTVDIIINNAALASLGPVAGLSHQHLVDVFTANAIFPTLLVQALLPLLSRDGGARIVNVSSEGAHLGRANTTAYSASKAALESMTRTWAKELGQEYQGLTVNAVVLGLVDTDLWKALPDDRKRYWKEKLRDNAVEARIGVPGDVAGVVAFLVGKEAGWVSGQCLAVGGGGLMK